MRILRSSVKTKNTAPLFLPFCPAAHRRDAATVDSSRVVFSGILLSIQTRIWLEVSFSYRSRRALTASARSADRTPALSVTYRSGAGGIATAAPSSAAARQKERRAAPARRDIASPVYRLPPSAALTCRESPARPASRS